MKKSRLIIILLIAVAVLAAAGFFFYSSGIAAADPDDDALVTVNIPDGSSASAIIDILDENGLIKNKTMAKIHIRIGGYDSLQANSYLFRKNMDLTEIMKAIDTGDFEYLSKNAFTIIEGATIPQAAESISENMPFSAEDLIKKWNDRTYLKKLIEKYWFLSEEILKDEIMYSLEGYIYPETYIVTSEKPTPEEVTDIILSMTDKVLSERKDEIAAMDMSVHEFLSLAAVVENESLFEKDRPVIAGVFINRLKKDMPLQSDITVLYALQEKRVNVTYKDLEVDSAYNTYMHAGLPVGPVCSPSAPAMDDVLHYEKSNYLYFFATEDGKVIYSKTLAEHEKAVNENMWY